MPPAWADESHLGDIISNLVENGVKYSPEGSSIIISAHEDNDGITISVKDYGIGIPRHSQKYLFKRFYRANNKNDREVYGHGLGLYFCQKLVEAQNGKIWMESTGVDGEGSTFFVHIPTSIELEND